MTPLVRIDFPSIYVQHGVRALLPDRMARCAPDTKACLFRAADKVKDMRGELFLSDLFRSYEMQLGSYNDYASGKKKAFSPPPGGSLHEAGRAFDLDLGALKMSLRNFWDIAEACDLSPIISAPDAKKSEAWHFECRGSHSMVYDYYKRGEGNNFKSPYEAMAASAIISAGIRHDKYPGREKEGYVQSALIRLGQHIGNLDGLIGRRTREALAAMGLTGLDLDAVIAALDDQLQTAFPHEFFENVAPAPVADGAAEFAVFGAPTPLPTTAILTAAAASPIANYRWRDRGRAPAGYIKGTALAFAETLRRLRSGEPDAAAMAAPLSGNSAKDALDWYSSELVAAGSDLRGTGEERLVALFTLLLGLGMRESSGQHCEGRDMSAANTSAKTAETGLFQVSFNSVNAAPELKPLFDGFDGRNDLLDVFDQGVSCGRNSWRNWGTGDGERFQALTKSCPMFAVSYAGVLARVNRKHWGPLNLKKVEARPEAVALFRNIRALVSA